MILEDAFVKLVKNVGRDTVINIAVRKIFPERVINSAEVPVLEFGARDIAESVFENLQCLLGIS